MNKVLTIAGSDCSGGAGIQADIKTIVAHKLYAMSAITALTAQNTLKVSDIVEVTPLFLKEQLDAIFNDIRPDSIKIGMVANVNLIKQIAKSLVKYHAKNIVLDPVMVATSGSKLISDNAINSLIKYLFPLATIITPNIPETEILAKMKIKNVSDMEVAAKKIAKLKVKAILIKGGHSINDANDLLYYNNKCYWIKGKRIKNSNTHGTGCTLSSAIACNLALNKDIKTAVINAKHYISDCLSSHLNLGHGSGPIDHTCHIKELKWK
ncbi:MAG: bifunctional hydroxymethylpyrimidine kinase/phosphomethylpyrimidine kinase [Malacoplasma sp.]|nr:bifunctional hydroxymethylpyrimidine kinase/phosphomethylpyrimidine kinase [Malacoplasma sp.]